MQSRYFITEHARRFISCNPKVPAHGLTSAHREASGDRSKNSFSARCPVNLTETSSAQMSRSVRLFSGHPLPVSRPCFIFLPGTQHHHNIHVTYLSLFSVCLPHWNDSPGEHRFLSVWLTMVNTPEMSAQPSEHGALRRQPPGGGREGRIGGWREESIVKMK